MGLSLPKIGLQLRGALLETGLIQPVDHCDSLKHFWTLCRLVPGQEANWLQVVDRVLTAFELHGTEVELFLARRYLLREGSMVFGWHIGLIAKSGAMLETSVGLLVNVLQTARPVLEQVEAALPPPPMSRPSPPPASQRRVLAPGQHPPPRPASPRAPTGGNAQLEPPGYVASIRIVKQEIDNDGKQTIVEEMPLPHVHHELNVPNAKGKGATYSRSR